MTPEIQAKHPDVEVPEAKLEHARKAVEHEAQSRDLDPDGEKAFFRIRSAYAEYMQIMGDETMVEKRPDVEEGLEIAAERLDSMKNNWGPDGKSYDAFEHEDDAVEALEEFVDHYENLLTQFEREQQGLQDYLSEYDADEPDFPPPEEDQLF